jgi:hypothetical protein
MNDSRSRPTAALILGIFVALGLTLSGFFVARAVETAKRFERFVTVKGLSHCHNSRLFSELDSSPSFASLVKSRLST